MRKDMLALIGETDVYTFEDMLQTARKIKQTGAIESGFETVWCGDPDNCYDLMATVWTNFAWSFGGEIWDPETYRIQGILDSKTNADALTFARELYLTGVPEAIDNGFAELTDAMCSGRAAIGMVWAAAMGPFLNETSCPSAVNFTFSIVPGQVVRYILSILFVDLDAYTSVFLQGHRLTLGGMGLHISAQSPHRETLRDLVAWSQSAQAQRLWARLGGLSTRKSMLATGSFLSAKPYHPMYAVSFPLVKDLWNIPEYSELLRPMQINLRDAVAGNLTSSEALSRIASIQQSVILRAYPDGPPLRARLTRVNPGATVGVFVISCIGMLGPCFCHRFQFFYRPSAYEAAS
jgi:multiple sugar transport system substrate-binding protein